MQISDRTPSFIKVVGIYQFIMMCLSSIFLCSPPTTPIKEKKKFEVEITETLLEENDRTEECIDLSKKNEKKTDPNKEEPTPLTLYSAIKSKPFINSFFLCFLSTGTCFMISINVKNYGIIKIPDDEFVTLIIGAATLTNGSTRILWGYLYDKFGFKKLFGFTLFFQLILLVLYCPLAHYKIFFAINNIGLITILGIYFVIFTPLWMELFDARLANAIVVWGYFSFSFATIFQFLIIFFLNPLIGYEGIVMIECLLVILCGYLLYKFQIPHKGASEDL